MSLGGTFGIVSEDRAISFKIRSPGRNIVVLERKRRVGWSLVRPDAPLSRI